ncbi:hypothetical protein [Intestinibacter sp.]
MDVEDLYNSPDITHFLDTANNLFVPDDGRIEDLKNVEVDDS